MSSPIIISTNNRVSNSSTTFASFNTLSIPDDIKNYTRLYLRVSLLQSWYSLIVEFVILTVQSAEERNIVFRNVLLLFLLMFCPARMCQKGRALQTDLVVMTNSVDCCLIEMMWKNDVTFCLIVLQKCPYWTEVEVSGLFQGNWIKIAKLVWYRMTC